MLEKIKKINNPLTIIAMFSGIAEISGSAVLPLIESQNQEKYLWFLILFPSILVILFFITLNFNYKVLYAPSDFRDEDNFVRLLDKGTIIEKTAKLKQELKEEKDVKEKSTLVFNIANKVNPISKTEVNLLSRNMVSNYLLAEELVLAKLSKELKIPFQRDTGFRSPSGKRYMLDGVYYNPKSLTAVEIKYFEKDFNLKSIKMAIDKIKDLFNDVVLTAIGMSSMLILGIATDLPEIEFEKAKDKINEIIKGYNFPINLYIYNLKSLEKEFGL